jgi:acyl phosphate:glycerol-3-phosphate acyltransferase
MIEFVAVVIGSYLIGSIPSGLIIGKLRRVDIREYGSGNIGTTNVLRTLGARYGALVLIADVFKGVIAVLLARYIIGSPMSEMAAGFAAVAGHDWSLFLKFKGGRGVATSLGALLPLVMPAPLTGVIGLAAFVLVTLASRYVSLASIVGSVSAVVAMAVFMGMDRVPWEYLVYIVVVVALIIFQHRDNISRLRSGTESKLGQKGERRQAT